MNNEQKIAKQLRYRSVQNIKMSFTFYIVNKEH
jgi:hypothetical protein